MENHVSEWNANCWSSAARSLLWWSVSRGCDECIQFEELCRAKRLHLAVGHRQSVVTRIARLASAKLQLERRFVRIGCEYASSNERSLV